MLEQYYQELVHFARQRAPDRDTAEDVVQETYARVLAMAGQVVLQHPRAVLYRTARNILIDHYRREQALPPAVDASGEVSLPAAPDCDPEWHLIQARCTSALLGTIAALPQRCRQAFIHFKFDGLAQAEIAQAMGISRNMVEKHVMNGMQACHRCLAALDG
ncbi:sigma-70 family RNA polymerase sigma factor [Paludibacterium yongneupense]|uniref:sigma-70 family RNA polymerase sigma factor n=1 Tax=Paludibacterium yongneupense TaxID=400061 RepID=UPI00040593C2|nr:sigma-70 family RNA polymerase sigma factor [Paludibacterium yongneupense]